MSRVSLHELMRRHVLDSPSGSHGHNRAGERLKASLLQEGGGIALSLSRVSPLVIFDVYI